MEVKELIVKKIGYVPEPYLMEILDFIRFKLYQFNTVIKWE